MHHPLRDLHHVWWPVPLTVALVIAAGVVASLPLPNGVAP
jgi:hypothetical protein